VVDNCAVCSVLHNIVNDEAFEIKVIYLFALPLNSLNTVDTGHRIACEHKSLTSDTKREEKPDVAGNHDDG